MAVVRRFAVLGALTALLLIPVGMGQGLAQPRPHVYLLRGLINIFSLGMDDLAAKIRARGIEATVSNHLAWQSDADSAAAAYKAGREGPIILIGHSFGADAVMEMADYLDKQGVPVALIVPFDASQSFATPKNVQRIVNITQRGAFMTKGPGFHGSLTNMDVSNDPSIGHLNIDKSPRLHGQVVGYVMAAAHSGHGVATASPAAKPASATGADKQPATSAEPAGAPATSSKPQSSGNGAANGTGSVNSHL